MLYWIGVFYRDKHTGGMGLRKKMGKVNDRQKGGVLRNFPMLWYVQVAEGKDMEMPPLDGSSEGKEWAFQLSPLLFIPRTVSSKGLTRQEKGEWNVPDTGAINFYLSVQSKKRGSRFSTLREKLDYGGMV